MKSLFSMKSMRGQETTYLAWGFFLMALVSSLVADPTLRVWQAWELGLGASFAVFSVIVFLQLIKNSKGCFKSDLVLKNKALLTVLAAYAGVLVYSALLGMAYDISLWNIVRSIGPYGIYILTVVGLTMPLMSSPYILWRVGFCAVAVLGGIQAFFILYLYLSHLPWNASTLDTLVNRTTLLDARTTLPFFLTSAIIPLFWMNWRKPITVFSSLSLITLSLLAAVATLTRSHVLGILIAYCSIAVIGGVASWNLRIGNPQFFLRYKIVTGGIALAICLAAVICTTLSPFQLSTRAFSMRSDIDIFDMPEMPQDIDNGRIDDEWIPAWQTWRQGGPVTLLLGLGSGNPFYTASHDPRTYIHNVVLYWLVYGGGLGLAVWLTMQALLAQRLLQRVIVHGDTTAFAILAVLAALGSYAMLFAVHKLISFNLIWALCMASAILSPLPFKVAERPLNKKDTIDLTLLKESQA